MSLGGGRGAGDHHQARRRLLGRLDQATYVDPSKTTLSDFLDRWLQHMGTVRDARTVERYGELLRLHVRPTLAGVPLQKLTPVHFTDLYARLLAEGRRDGRPGGLSPRTVGHVHRALHRAGCGCWSPSAWRSAAAAASSSRCAGPTSTSTREPSGSGAACASSGGGW